MFFHPSALQPVGHGHNAKNQPPEAAFLVVCLFVWPQSFLRLSEEQLESISEPCLCLFSEFVAAGLFFPEKEGFFLAPNGLRASSGG